MAAGSQVVGNAHFDGPRPAQLAEREALLEMVNAVFRVSRGFEATIASDWAHVYTPRNLENVLVICDRSAGGKPVASTGIWVSDVRVASASGQQGVVRVGGINCVGTLPEYRRHGFGSQVMAAVQQRMVELKCQVGLLSTGIADWYRRLDWEEAGMQRTYRLNRGNVALLPALRPEVRFRLVDLDTLTEPDENGEASVAMDPHVAAQVVQVQQQGQLGALREVKDFCRRCAARRMQRLALLEDNGAIVAYLLLRDNMVAEWAGAPADVIGLLAACFGALDNPHVSTSQRDGNRPMLLVRAPGWAHPVTAQLDRLRIPFHMDYLGMMLLLEPQAVLDGCAADRVTIEQVNGDYLVVEGDQRMTLNRRQLTKLLFGPERMGEVGAGIFPLRFWQWGLEMV